MVIAPGVIAESPKVKKTAQIEGSFLAQETTSVDFLREHIGPPSGFEKLTFYYLEPPQDPKTEQADVLFHHGRKSSQEKTARFSMKAARRTIYNPKNKSQVHIYFTDQNGDGDLDSIGITEIFQKGGKRVDHGFVYLVPREECQSTTVYYSYMQKYRFNRAGKITTTQKLSQKDPALKDLIDRLRWVWRNQDK